MALMQNEKSWKRKAYSWKSIQHELGYSPNCLATSYEASLLMDLK